MSVLYIESTIQAFKSAFQRIFDEGRRPFATDVKQALLDLIEKREFRGIGYITVNR